MDTWIGEVPLNCQLCETVIDVAFVDGKAVARGFSGWAIMCPVCALIHNVELGLGKGQLYIKSPLSDKFIKVNKNADLSAN